MAKLSPEAEKILTARTEAIDELKAIDGADRKVTDPAVIRLSNARLYEQNITMRVLAGDPVTAPEFKAATDMIEAARNTTAKPIRVDVEIVDGVTGLFTCQHCHKENRFENYTPPPAPSLSRVIEGEAIPLHKGGAHPASIVKPAAPPKPSAPEPKPLDIALYNENFAKGAPIKRATVVGSYDRFLGAHANTNAITGFGEPSYKPRSDGGVS